MDQIPTDLVLRILQAEHPLVFENCVLKARLQVLTAERIDATEDEEES